MMRRGSSSWACICGVVTALAAVGALAQTAPADDEALQLEDDSGDLGELDLGRLLDEPIVTVASRRAQPILDVGASVSVITSDDIERYGITNLAEVMRLVPGASVAQFNEGQYNVSFRGNAQINNNRVLVLIDGRSVFELANSTVFWSALSISPGDVAKIEIIRGPASTFYGANAFSGVISITTKRPLDWRGGSANLSGGLNYLNNPSYSPGRATEYSNSVFGNVAYADSNEAQTFGGRLSVGFTHDGEFEENVRLPAVRNGQHNFHVNASTHYRYKNLELFGMAAFAQDEHVFSPIPQGGPSPVAYRDGNFVLSAELSQLANGTLSLRANIDGRIQDGDAVFIDNVTPLTFERLNPNQKRLHSIVQADHVALGGRNTLTAAIEGSVEKTWDLYNSDPRVLYGAIMAQDEVRLLADRSLQLTVGGRYEVIGIASKEFASRFANFNPRAAVNWRFRAHQSLRITAGSSYRTPTPIELYTDLRPVDDGYPDDTNPPVSFIKGNRSLRPELVRAVEVGYRAIINERLFVDVTGFYQSSSNLVTFSTEQTYPLQYANATRSRNQVGVEASSRYALTDSSNLRVAYTAIATLRQEGAPPQVQWPPHLVNLGFDTRIRRVWTIATLGYFSFNQHASIFRPQGYSRDGAVAETIWVDARIGRLFLDGKVELSLTGRNLIAPLRPTSDLRQLPTSAFDAIGTTFLVSVLVKESN